MTITHKTILILLLPLLLGACEQATNNSLADSNRIIFEPHVHSKTFGQYVVHINGLTTDQLPQEVARGYSISRSKNRAMINISVLQEQDNHQIPITATINIATKNLSNQLKNVSLREIKEDNPTSVYYIGELAVSHEEMLIFDLDIRPTGSEELLQVRYRQKFYTE